MLQGVTSDSPKYCPTETFSFFKDVGYTFLKKQILGISWGEGIELGASFSGLR